TDVSEFLLLELSEDPELQPVLAGLFLSMYLVTVLGNLLIILAVSSDSHLHNPMYFFLSNLSLADIGFTSITVPKVIQSHLLCGLPDQMSLFAIFGGMEVMLLSVMAYDRFVAICYPLYYPVIMNPRFCAFLVLLSFFLSLLDSQLHNWTALQITCFKDVEIPNFFCDPSQLPNLACCDTFTNNIVMYFPAAIFGFLPISGILFSCYKIVSSVLWRYKAFSTCGSHLSVVCLFYGTGVGGYLSSDVSSYPRKGAVTSVMYTVVTSMLNLFIYSLRNRDIQSALRRLQGRIV
uniref:Olfactory receptor n=1 Tax=Rhinopithecus roxellana TaxID=61622 RepID=A0A2K6R9M1_RHIRO